MFICIWFLKMDNRMKISGSSHPVRTLYHLMRADFLERVRRYSFLMVLAGTIYLGFAINRGDFYLELDGYRGVLNSAWVGGLMATSAVFLVSLFGFFLVKNSIDRDIQTGVGQIIATTPISRGTYLFGKWLSNFTVLIALMAILALAAVIMQLIGGEATTVELWPLLAPFLLLAAPAMAMVAAMALFFETIPWLRGGFGNVAYVGVWLAILIYSLESKIIWWDWSGILIVSQTMGASLLQVYPAYSGGFNLTGGALPAGGLSTFIFLGIPWTGQLLLSRLVWLLGSFGLVFAGVLFFHRFDPSYEKIRSPKEKRKSGKSPDDKAVQLDQEEAVRLTALSVGDGATRFNFIRILAAEARLFLKGQPWWWYAVALGLVIACLFSSIDSIRQGLLPALWIWPVLIWSGLGNREVRFNTGQIVFSAPRPLGYQLSATWFAGFLLAAVLGLPAAVRMSMAGDGLGLLSLIAGALFIPSLALCLGVWTGSGKVFEIVYCLLWYLGPLNRIAPLDFMGSTTRDYGLVYLSLSLILLFFAAFGRWRQLRTR
jgi:hypothetical protein